MNHSHLWSWNKVELNASLLNSVAASLPVINVGCVPVFSIISIKSCTCLIAGALFHLVLITGVIWDVGDVNVWFLQLSDIINTWCMSIGTGFRHESARQIGSGLCDYGFVHHPGQGQHHRAPASSLPRPAQRWGKDFRSECYSLCVCGFAQDQTRPDHNEEKWASCITGHFDPAGSLEVIDEWMSAV